MNAVLFQAVIDATIDTFNANTYTQRLASYLNIAPTYITVEASSGSLVVNATIHERPVVAVVTDGASVATGAELNLANILSALQPLICDDESCSGSAGAANTALDVVLLLSSAEGIVLDPSPPPPPPTSPSPSSPAASPDTAHEDPVFDVRSEQNSKGSGLSRDTIIIICAVTAAVVAICLAALICMLIRRNKRRKSELPKASSSRLALRRHPSGSPGPSAACDDLALRRNHSDSSSGIAVDLPDMALIIDGKPKRVDKADDLEQGIPTGVPTLDELSEGATSPTFTHHRDIPTTSTMDAVSSEQYAPMYMDNVPNSLVERI